MLSWELLREARKAGQNIALSSTEKTWEFLIRNICPLRENRDSGRFTFALEGFK